MTQAIEKMTIHTLSQAIAQNRLTPLQITEHFLDRAATHSQTEKTYARLSHDRTLAEATAATERQSNNQRLSPLDGVPISWKDLFDTKDIATESGSKLLEGRIPNEDAETLQNASKAGLVCLGKTHLSELAFSGLGLNPITQTTPCVNDLDAVAGGSSSGAAGSVAFGLAAGAIGSDTGGSVRIPAAWNDLVGLKTTHGVLSGQGMVPLCSSFDTAGPLTKTVTDAAMLFQAMAGDAIEVIEPITPNKIGVLKTVVLEDAEPAVVEAYERVLDKLSGAGVKLVEFDFNDLQEALDLAPIIFNYEAYHLWKREIETDGDKMYPPIRERFLIGANFSKSQFDTAWQRLRDLRANWYRTVQDFDTVVLPTGPILPPNQKRLLEDEDYYTRANLLALRNTRVGNMMELCSTTLPTETPSVGISFLGLPNKDRHLLRMSAAIEKIIS